MRRNTAHNILLVTLQASFLYNLNTLSSSTVTDELRTRTCSGVTVLSSHWSGTQQTSPYPKTLYHVTYHVTGHVVDERAILIFFISKFSNRGPMYQLINGDALAD